MEAWLEAFFADLHWSLLGLTIALSLYAVGRSADWLVDEAVELSKRSNIPKTVIGATIVSVGTTMPEAAVSVLAAINGAPGLALGNAVGSVICDTGLILGVACLISPLPLDRKIVNRQGWIQLGAGFLLVAACLPWSNPMQAFTEGGRLPQWLGFAFLGGLALYLYQSIVWARKEAPTANSEEDDGPTETLWVSIFKLLTAVALVVVFARILIPAVTEAAERMAVPEAIVAATLVAFGTSLPELVTAVAAARRGHGELAVGNVVGADILNVLFVAGAAAAVTPGGLLAGPQFFEVLFPIMLFILMVFRVGVILSGQVMRRPFGWILIAAYVFYLVISYATQSLPNH